jgi:hypothetical protein
MESGTMISSGVEKGGDYPAQTMTRGDISATNAVSKIGFWSSVLTCLLAVQFRRYPTQNNLQGASYARSL